MNDLKPFCFPVCLPCREAVCPKAIPPRTPRKPSDWHPDRLTGKILGCGCRCEIIPVVNDIISLKEVWCPRHGWVKPPAKTTVKEKDSEVQGQMALGTDEPPF